MLDALPHTKFQERPSQLTIKHANYTSINNICTRENYVLRKNTFKSRKEQCYCFDLERDNYN